MPIAASRLTVFVETYQPKTFRERGVAAPFTTPALAGARLRTVPGRPTPTLEMVMPNPTGGRGVYIVAWFESGDLCRPGMHDSRLAEQIAAAEQPLLTPALVRQAAWETAARGYAGRAAAAAATRALREHSVRFAMTSTRLHQELVNLGGETPPDDTAWERLVALVAYFSPPAGARSRPRALLAAIGALALSLPGWVEAPSGPITAAARAVRNAAVATEQLADRLLAQTEERLAQPAALLRGWLADPQAVEEELTRPEWLLDGWERMVQLYKLALPAPVVVVQEMAALLPPWPDEVETWLALPPGTATRLTWRRPMAAIRPWADTTADAIARNELLLAQAI
jgi:hypothetical protein